MTLLPTNLKLAAYRFDVGANREVDINFHKECQTTLTCIHTSEKATQTENEQIPQKDTFTQAMPCPMRDNCCQTHLSLKDNLKKSRCDGSSLSIKSLRENNIISETQVNVKSLFKQFDIFFMTLLR